MQRVIELTHAHVAEDPHLIVGADDLVPPVDEEGVEDLLSLVVGGPLQRGHPRGAGALGLVAGDVAVPEVKVGGEEASHAPPCWPARVRG